MNNRINQLFTNKKDNILSIYFTAGFPNLNDTPHIIRQLEKSGVDLIEIGIPFSDPSADGPTIQKSNEQALRNGMSLHLLFDQLKDIRNTVTIPLILMGYVNPVLQFGIEAFCKKCNEAGIDGVILPDLPVEEYESRFRDIFKKYNLINVFLISPQTTDERIHLIDKASEGFIYMVSSSSTTGAGKKAEDFKTDYFTRIQQMKLNNPRLIGFGISDHSTFNKACRYASGAIIGSAFVSALQEDNFDISQFVKSIRHPL